MNTAALTWLAQYESNSPSSSGGFFGCFILLVELAICVLIVAGFWKVFQKAGKPGWAAIVPIYNVIVLLEIVGKPWWWVLLMLIPFVNIVISILVNIEVARKFGQGTGFAIGLVFLPMIFFPILGFGEAQYNASA